jgi:hypothetical protein
MHTKILFFKQMSLCKPNLQKPVDTNMATLSKKKNETGASGIARKFAPSKGFKPGCMAQKTLIVVPLSSLIYNHWNNKHFSTVWL